MTVDEGKVIMDFALFSKRFDDSVNQGASALVHGNTVDWPSVMRRAELPADPILSGQIAETALRKVAAWRALKDGGYD